MAIFPPPFPTGSSLAELCQEIKSIDAKTRELGPWKSGAFSKLASHGCLAGWIKKDDGGTEASETEVMTFLVSIASSCLTTALALTQWASAVRIISRGSQETRARFLPDLAAGQHSTTVGISQLTTSSQHLGRPILTAKKIDNGLVFTWQVPLGYWCRQREHACYRCRTIELERISSDPAFLYPPA